MSGVSKALTPLSIVLIQPLLQVWQTTRSLIRIGGSRPILDFLDALKLPMRWRGLGCGSGMQPDAQSTLEPSYLS
jgi:hypothetical protein